jgi:uncharacterized protein YyaL (SSP411 family)
LEIAFNEAIDWISGPALYKFNNNYGVIYGHQLRRKANPLIYFEATGYGIKLFLNLYKWLRNRTFLDLATKLADSLLEARCLQDPCYGAFPYGYVENVKKMIHMYYSFDNAIIASALIDLYKLSKEEQLINIAEGICMWLTRFMQNHDGSFKAVFDLEKCEFTRINNWFGDKSCLHAKNSISLLKLYVLTGNEQLRNRAEKVCDWVLKLQRKDGAFRATIYEEYTFTHAHCYATEGLLYGYYALNNIRYLEGAIKAGLWLMNMQNPDGSLYEIYNGKNSTFSLKRRVTDASSQAIRIWIMLYYLTGDDKFFQAAQKSAKFIIEMQCKENKDLNGYGGFFHACKVVLKHKIVDPWISSWSTMFAIHALNILKNLQGNRFDELLEELF